MDNIQGTFERLLVIGSLYDLIPEDLQEESFENLIDTPQVRIERIVSKGQASKPGFWYDQETSEFVLLVKGRAGLRFENREGVLVLGSGDYVNIRAHEKHRIEWTDHNEETIWLAVHYL